MNAGTPSDCLPITFGGRSQEVCGFPKKHRKGIFMKLLYSNTQNYAWILERARHLLENADEKDRIGMQINRRIYNNAFCSLMRLSFPFIVEGEGNAAFIKMEYDGHEYGCPVSAAKTILRDSYEKVISLASESLHTQQGLLTPLADPDKKTIKEIRDHTLILTKAAVNRYLREMNLPEAGIADVKNTEGVPANTETPHPDSIPGLASPEKPDISSAPVSSPSAPDVKQKGMITVSGTPYQYGDAPEIQVNIDKGDYKEDDLIFECRPKDARDDSWEKGMPTLPGEYVFRVSAKETDQTQASFAVCMVTVQKREIEVKADAVAKEYDGNSAAEAQVDIVNAVAGDSVEAEYTAMFDAPDPGDRRVIIRINKLAGADADKYTIGNHKELRLVRKILPGPKTAEKHDLGKPDGQAVVTPPNVQGLPRNKRQRLYGAGIPMSAPVMPDWDDFEFSKPKPKHMLDLDAQPDSDNGKDDHREQKEAPSVKQEPDNKATNTEPAGQEKDASNIDEQHESEPKASVPETVQPEQSLPDRQSAQPSDRTELAQTDMDGKDAEVGTEPDDGEFIYLSHEGDETNDAGVSDQTPDSKVQPEEKDAEGAETAEIPSKENNVPMNQMTSEDMDGVSGNDVPADGLFHPKHATQTQASPEVGCMEEKADEGIAKDIKTKPGLFSRLMGQGRAKKEAAEPKVENKAPATAITSTENGPAAPSLFTPRVPVAQPDVPEPVVIKDDWSGKTEAVFDAEEPKTADYTHDGGVLFHHVHKVVLKKKFASSSVGPYRFVFWPIWIYDRFVGRKFADFLVHVTDPNGNEYISCTEGDLKELLPEFDGIQFKVFATWHDGVFESKVALNGRTDSIYRIEEEVYKEEPEENFSNSYLDQFRLERKGQPKHFIIPFKNNNCGERNIPIVGYVEVKRKRYPLERRDGNTLSYRYSNGERIIKGHWEQGTFKFTVEDANRL